MPVRPTTALPSAWRRQGHIAAAAEYIHELSASRWAYCAREHSHDATICLNLCIDCTAGAQLGTPGLRWPTDRIREQLCVHKEIVNCNAGSRHVCCQIFYAPPLPHLGQRPSNRRVCNNVGLEAAILHAVEDAQRALIITNPRIGIDHSAVQHNVLGHSSLLRTAQPLFSYLSTLR